MSRKLSLAAGAIALALVAPVSAVAADNPYERGPDPTVDTIRSTAGYQVLNRSVPNGSTPGFGAANVWAPSNSAPGETFGAVAISPGFLAPEVTIKWLGPRLAAQGFVVITFETNNPFDQPASRGLQLLAALRYLTTSSSQKAKVDPSRLAVVGHSMGGGGTLEAAKRQPSLKAAVALTPWNQDKTWPEIQTPTLIVGAENDTIAPNATHSVPFYNSLPATLPKAYLELNAVDHLIVIPPFSPNTAIATSTITWLKRFVDNDTRYSPMLCPAPIGPPAGSIQTYRSTCDF